jgi:formylmethanofuran dehydrogenase subunit E
MLSLAEYFAKVYEDGPPAPGIILDIRICVLAMKLLEIDDPSALRRQLIVVAETDRCLPDVIEMVLGCRLANRTLKFRDWGKMAASFLDLTRNRAVRVAARELNEPDDLKAFLGMEREEALREAYKIFSDEKLMMWQPVIINFQPQDLPGHRSKRVPCSKCGEGISFDRQVERDGLTLCRACAGEAYWSPAGPE